MDVEGPELEGIDFWLDEGAFKNVHQFALEYHLHVGGFRYQTFLGLHCLHSNCSKLKAI